LSPDELAHINPIVIKDYLLDHSVNVMAKESLLAQLSPPHRRILAVETLHASKMYKADKEPTNFLEFTSVVLSMGHLTTQRSQELFERDWSLYYALMSALLSATEIEKEKHQIYVHALLAQYEMVQSYLREARTTIEACKDLYDLFYEMFEDILKVKMPEACSVVDHKMHAYFEEEEPKPIVHDSEDTQEEEEEEEKQQQQVFCVCRGPEKGFMIQCSLCDEWYHGKCVKITETQAKKIREYVCDPCAESGAATSPSKKRKIEEEEELKPQKRPRKRRTLPKKLSNNT
jgi:hypothetical protein